MKLCLVNMRLVNVLGLTRLPDTLGNQPLASARFPFGTPLPKDQLFISGNDVHIILDLANLTNAPTTVASVELRVVNFAPFTDTVANAFAACDGRVYSASGGIKGRGACQFTVIPALTYGFPVSLPAIIKGGITIPLQLSSTTLGQAGPGPATIAPFQTNQGTTTALDVDIVANRSGTYQFQVGVGLQDGELGYFAPVMTALALTPDAIGTYWSTANCVLPNNSSQVPATGRFLCPGPLSTG